MYEILRDCPAPAKLNLFLHIVGRRPNGYHELQTVFQLIDWADTLHFERRSDARIVHTNPLPGVPPETDLTVRAARLLQAHCGVHFGVDIAIEKRLPAGGGIGGGSSDAATTLLALNRMWQLDLPRAELQTLALKLGADVPFFVFGRNAFAEGLGEELYAVDLPQRHFLVVNPRVHVATDKIFRDPLLTRDTKIVTMAFFLEHASENMLETDEIFRNDMQAAVTREYAEVAAVIDWFRTFTTARMTGSGASVFAVFDTKADAEAACKRLPERWLGQVTTSLAEHPMFGFA
ncbi:MULTISPECIES: 4-(cytidine 5'-diphospho)-2-C-methyl-D-erythritol kinase [Pandoraea]|uniref:4-diphosphocytidyl-2-C-methyl-D-erythritol kinase n=1 Tax=Pandoraea communis TaxID=2508297 RepID=A0A5E4S286_9BURK|nr:MULTISPECIES: 4-(cytidine 5'-diphospho)-2-C-methyl-D-erythritol kinase [Pandoraea]EON14494.1 4-diphosphocytidyl-2-C-methyl-D-erythritol kinase [Pandoraea sp. SD6-2]VVD68189.1 4-diphosphocytidyl-2C-methyl-D-erythritol kinase [Pandoraea communis]